MRQRMWPAYQGEVENPTAPTYVNPRATTHILIGGAGNDEMNKGDDDVAPSSFTQVVDAEEITRAYDEAHYIKRAGSDAEPAFVAFKDVSGAYGISMIHVANSTHLHFEYVQTETKKTFDEIWLVRERHN
jgi:hypothetical protein